MMLPRGIRNHNPSNIRKGNTQWQGLDTPPDDGEFFRFVSPAYGIRAMARVLITYQDKRRAADGSPIDTVREIIERWAPPSENDTDSYAANVRQIMGVAPGTTLDVHDHKVMSTLVKAIIKHENGIQPYSQSQIDKGLVLAGIEPRSKSLQKSRTVQGAQVAAAGTVLGTAAQYADQVSTVIPVAERFFTWVPAWAIGGVVLLGVAYILYARLNDRARGLR